MRLPDPRRSEFRSEGDDEQHRNAADAFDGLTQHFKARGIGPIDILEDHEHRLAACQHRELQSKGFPCPLSTLLRRKREGAIATIAGKRHQFGKECCICI